MTVREVLFCAKWSRHHPGAFARFDEIIANETRSAGELAAIQERARRDIVRAAFEHTAFYKKYYSRCGFKVGDIGTEGWFERLPVVTKADIRAHFEEMTNPALVKFRKTSTTGGSTGTPTKTGFDGRVPEEIYSWRQQKWFGVNPWDDHAYVWRDTRKTKLAKFQNAALWWPTRHLKLDASFITEEAIKDFIRKYNRLRPSLLYGYVGAITQLAQYIERNHLEAWSPKFVWVTSAPLSPVQRALIGKVFRTKVCDQYGSCEIRGIAQQCPECRGLHVNIEHVHVEFVDAANRPVRAGEYGRTLLTNLEDEVFPLIRYENGDRGRWLEGSCPCGRTLPCIDSVKGRESESFVLPSGKTINGEFLTTIFDDDPELVRGFRVVQHRDLSITIEYIPNADAGKILSVLEGFARRLGGEVLIDFKQVNEISHDRGKLRFVVREV